MARKAATFHQRCSGESQKWGKWMFIWVIRRRMHDLLVFFEMEIARNLRLEPNCSHEQQATQVVWTNLHCQLQARGWDVEGLLLTREHKPSDLISHRGSFFFFIFLPREWLRYWDVLMIFCFQDDVSLPFSLHFLTYVGSWDCSSKEWNNMRLREIKHCRLVRSPDCQYSLGCTFSHLV